ncbi:Gp49 family protein [Halomonas koreensis]|uniref:Gp49 family protein n=1 Tax=Halomonas koreensis TaxID=245385 RepID=A0ABU1G4V3_9GAMM|nr:Gp49 family protein [Halomonas koreensis]MDR5867935.1 Gp49 family protein [Halomonas koreensis]
MSDDQQVEQQIRDRGLTAPRVTPDTLDEKIQGEDYHVFPGTTVTVCLLHLENGFTVTGESACASRENFDPELGRQIARRNAREKIWMLEGYLLRERLHSSGPLSMAMAES